MNISPFRYPGGKHKMLSILMSYIESMLLQNNYFVDAFVGGGSVLLEVAQKYPSIKLHANDKDSTISSFWQLIADPNPINLHDLLERVKVQPTLELFYKLRETPPQDIVERAYHAIFFNRTTFSGIAYSGPIGGKNQTSKYTVDCRYNSKKLKSKILACHELLKGRTTVSNVDIDTYDILNSTNYPIYLDPPYFVKGDSLYPVSMSEVEHQNLSKLLSNRANWVLSYDDCPEIRSYYQSKTIIDLAARYCINGKKDNWENKNELIIIPN